MAVMHYYQSSTWKVPFFLYPKVWNGVYWVYVKPSIWDGDQWVTAVSQTTTPTPPPSPGPGGVPTLNPGNVNVGSGLPGEGDIRPDAFYEER